MFLLFIFLLGLAIGSFLNVAIYRLKSKESVLFGYSHCVQCKHKLIWYDLIPVLSFILTRGKCRYCGKKISWQYPGVELVTALLFTLIVYKQFNNLAVQQFDLLLYCSIAILLFYASALIVVFVYDLKHNIIPDKIVIPGIIVAILGNLLFDFLYSFKNYHIFSGELLLLNYKSISGLIAAFVAGGFFYLLVAVSKGHWMGGGDVKLALFMGFILGWPNILVGLFCAFISGAIIGLVLISLKRKTIKSQIPFGPFLCVSTIVAMLYGSQIVNWYLGLVF